MNRLMVRVKNKKMRFVLIFIISIMTLSANGQCIENIFKVRAMKVRWESVQYFHEESKKEQSFMQTISKRMWSYYFEVYIGVQLDFGEQNDSIYSSISEEIEKGKIFTEAIFRYAKEHNCAPYEAHEAIAELYEIKPIPVKRLSKEELNSYLEQMGTPEEAFKEYSGLIQTIKSEKEMYLKCIDVELAKSDLTGYANPYGFMNPLSSFLPRPSNLTKMEFLKIFKEFIFNNNEEFLPDGLRADTYLKSNRNFSSMLEMNDFPQ